MLLAHALILLGAGRRSDQRSASSALCPLPQLKEAQRQSAQMPSQHGLKTHHAGYRYDNY
jgi:hypothetical protein